MSMSLPPFKFAEMRKAAAKVRCLGREPDSSKAVSQGCSSERHCQAREKAVQHAYICSNLRDYTALD